MNIPLNKILKVQPVQHLELSPGLWPCAVRGYGVNCPGSKLVIVHVERA